MIVLLRNLLSLMIFHPFEFTTFLPLKFTLHLSPVPFSAVSLSLFAYSLIPLAAGENASPLGP